MLANSSSALSKFKLEAIPCRTPSSSITVVTATPANRPRPFSKAPPAFPALAGSKVVLASADQQLAVLLNGRPGTAMQSFAKLSNTEKAAVTTFTKNAFGNSTGTLVQPADVKAARK